MRIPRIHLPRELTTGQTVELDRGTGNYLLKVLRLRPGNPLTVFNGEGGEFSARITDQRPAIIEIGEFHDHEVESPLEITLAQGVSKGDRMDTAIQKAVELGVTRIVPVMTERSVVNLKGERREKRTRRWQSIIASACEQCGRNRLPAIEEPVGLGEWLDGGALEGACSLVLDPEAGAGFSDLERPSHVCLLIGPEGGLTGAEIRTANDAGYDSVGLGPRVLRTETAAITAISLAQALWGDLG